MQRLPRYGLLPPLPPRAARGSGDAPFPVGDPHVGRFAWAREAYHRALLAAPLASGDEVLLPDYHHGSEVEAVVRADLVPRFYALSADLAPDEDAVRALLGPRTRALHLTHVLGQPQDAPRWRRFCDDHGLLLVEDAAQALLARWAGEPVGSQGDIAFFCLYKTFGVPDGALVRTAFPVAEPASDPPTGTGGHARRRLAWALQHTRPLGPLGAGPAPPRPYDADADVALGTTPTPMSMTTHRLLPTLDESAAQRRRRNHAWLAAALEEVAPPLLSTLAPQASPFGLAIRVADAGSVVARLRRAGVTASDFWSVPHRALPRPEHAASAGLRGRVVLLPCHQELTERDLRRLAWTVRRALSATGDSGKQEHA